MEAQYLIPRLPGPIIQKGCGGSRYGVQLQICCISSYGQPILDEVLDVGLTAPHRKEEDSMLQNVTKPQWERPLGKQIYMGK
jgi:hypothetical protein